MTLNIFRIVQQVLTTSINDLCSVNWLSRYERREGRRWEPEMGWFILNTNGASKGNSGLAEADSLVGKATKYPTLNIGV